MLVETGSQTSVPALLAALDELGVAPDDLAGIAVTHIHLDHAGGVGDVAGRLPEGHRLRPRARAPGTWSTPRSSSTARRWSTATCSTRSTAGSTPTDAARIHVLEDGEDIVVSANRRLTTVDSPGHAKHHLALHDSESGLLFAGDAVGVRLPAAGILRPATPPPDFDLDQAIGSLRKFAGRSPSGVALAHFGLVPDPQETLAEAEEILTRWAEVAERAWRTGDDIAAALDAAFAVDPSTTSTRWLPRCSRRSMASTPTRPVSSVGSTRVATATCTASAATARAKPTARVPASTPTSLDHRLELFPYVRVGFGIPLSDLL